MLHLKAKGYGRPDDESGLQAQPVSTVNKAPLRALLAEALPTMNAQCLASVLHHFECRAYRKDEPLLRQGEVWDKAFLVERGLVRLHLVRPDGKEFNKNFYAEGALICPITSEMEEQASLFAISALKPTVVWQADARAFRTCLAQHGIWEPMRTALLARLLTHKLQREHDLLVLDGKTRYARFCEQHPELAAKLPLRHLASYLGLTDVSLSRIRRQMKIPGK